MNSKLTFSFRIRIVAVILTVLLILPFPGAATVWGQSEEIPSTETTETVTESETRDPESAEPEVVEEKRIVEDTPAEPEPATDPEPVADSAAEGEPVASEEDPATDLTPEAATAETQPALPVAPAQIEPVPVQQPPVPAPQQPFPVQTQPIPVQPIPLQTQPAVTEEGPPAEVKLTLAVLSPTSDTIPSVQRALLEKRIGEELARVDKFRVIPSTESRRKLAEIGLAEENCADVRCAAKLGAILGVDKTIVGTVVRINEGEWLVNAMMVDVETGRLDRTESVEHLGTFNGLQAAPMAILAERLSGVEPTTPPPARTAVVIKDEPEEEGGVAWWVYLLAGLGLAALAGGGGGGGGDDGGGGGGGGSSSGGVTVSW